MSLFFGKEKGKKIHGTIVATTEHYSTCDLSPLNKERSSAYLGLV
jgi:hypothetical protein